MVSKSDQRMMADARWKAYFSRQNAELARAKAGAARNRAVQASCEPGQPVAPNYPGDRFPAMSQYFPSSLDGRRVLLTPAELEIRGRRAQQHEFSAYGYQDMAKARERAARKNDPAPLYSPADSSPAGEESMTTPQDVADNYRAAAEAWQSAAREWDDAAAAWWPAA